MVNSLPRNHAGEYCRSMAADARRAASRKPFSHGRSERVFACFAHPAGVNRKSGGSRGGHTSRAFSHARPASRAACRCAVDTLRIHPDRRAIDITTSTRWWIIRFSIDGPAQGGSMQNAVGAPGISGKMSSVRKRIEANHHVNDCLAQPEGTHACVVLARPVRRYSIHQ